MYFRFCKLSILKWQYGIYDSVASNLSLVLGPHPSFSQGISCLQTPLLRVDIFWWLLSSTFLLLPVSPILHLLDSRLVEKRFLTEKVLNEMEFCILLLCQKFWNPVLFSNQAPTKCFNLPANGTSGILFDKNNLFINGWTFLDSHWIGFSGFKSTLKKVCCWVAIPTISLLLSPCLSVVGMTLLLLLLLVTIMEFSRSGFCEKKLLPLTFSWCLWGDKWKGLSVFYKILLGLFLWFDSVSNMVPELFSEQIFVMFL